MSATFCRVVNGGALVTACKAVTAVSLSANNVGFGAGVTLSWSGAAGGAGNPIRGYEVYRDGVLLTTVFDGTSCTVTSPANNASYKYTVKALGRIPGFDAPVSTASATLTSVVTAPTAPTSVWLSATDVRIGKSVTLSWSGAAGGTNNPVVGYKISRQSNGVWSEVATTANTSITVTASSTVGGQYAYSVVTLGAVPGTWSAGSGVVTLTAHGAEYVDYFFSSSGSFTVPAWSEKVQISVISGGGGGSGNTGDYHDHGGGGGASGYIDHRMDNYPPGGSVIPVTVGAGGGAGINFGSESGWVHADGGDGGTSSAGVYLGVGGGGGGKGNNGGHGGAGGGGGGEGCNGDAERAYPGGNGINSTGGAGGYGTYGCGGGGGGGWYGTNGENGVGGNWDSKSATGGVGTNSNSYYLFQDPATSRLFNATGGVGGPGHGAATAGQGGQGGKPGKDASGKALAGTGYGKGGDGGGGHGSATSGTNIVNPTAGQSGFVGVRVGRYLS